MTQPTLRRRLHRLLALLAAPVLAAGATVVLPATPAQAALTYRGTFTIKDAVLTNRCVAVENNGTTNRTPIVHAPCNGSLAQQWAVFQDSSDGFYWILAYGGDQRFNKCMDKGESHMWIYACHGGRQQRWNFVPNTTAKQNIQSLFNFWYVSHEPRLLSDPSNGLAVRPEISPLDGWHVLPV